MFKSCLLLILVDSIDSLIRIKNINPNCLGYQIKYNSPLKVSKVISYYKTQIFDQKLHSS